jgi:hypothetical protein
MPQPQSFLLRILVTVNPNGPPTANVVSYYDGNRPVTGPLSVNAGDQIGWVVQVAMPGGRKFLPYKVGFSSESFFGTSELDVPTGGTSPFLRVLELKDKISYTLQVTGVGCVFDPEIQSGSDASPLIDVLAVSAFEVTWNTVANTMSYTKGGTAMPFPMKVALGDNVCFVATVAPGSVTNFTIAFADNLNTWATPFDPNKQVFVADPANQTNIGPMGVGDPDDAGANFPFTASITVNGNPISFPPDPNVKITM